VARRVLLTSAARVDVGERLLSSKLQILSGTGNRRPSMALSILTGRVAEPRSDEPGAHPVLAVVAPTRPRSLARTVYLTDAHLGAIEAIIEAWQPGQSRRLTRSAVLRRAIEHLHEAVETDPAGTRECQ
jgi:hypothetical protein